MVFHPSHSWVFSVIFRGGPLEIHFLTIGSNGHHLHLEDANLLVQDVRQTIQGTRGPLELGFSRVKPGARWGPEDLR